MPIVIDAHEDLAYNSLVHGRDYRRSAVEIRRLEHDSDDPEKGYSLLGWPEYQKGQVAVVFGTLFAAPRHLASPGEPDSLVYANYDQANRLYRQQIDYYRRLCGENPELFRLVTSRKELDEVLEPWDQQPASPPDVSHPVGIVMLMEGADGVQGPGDLDNWWELGLRQIGMAWLGARYCGATNQTGSFTREGFALLDRMAEMGFTLDLSHMNMESAMEALERYPGPIIASHSNARAMIKGDQGRWSERHLTDTVLRLLIDRGGITGLVPFNKFLSGDWNITDGKKGITLENSIAQQIDYICQIAGNARHVGLGTDFDGGFGAQSTPAEVDTIADLQKLGLILQGRGYTEEDVRLILGGNWRYHLEEHLP